MRGLALLFLAVLGSVCGTVAAQAADDWPNSKPEKWGLAIIDIETTGLTPGYNEMIDIGLIYTDLEGNVLGEFYTRIQPDYPERLSEGAKAVNAFSPERWTALGVLSEPDAVAALKAFHEAHQGERRIMLTAFNSWFDAAFLQAFLAEEGENWRDMYHYHVLDIPSMAFGRGKTGVTIPVLAEQYGLEAETRVPEDHTGQTGAAYNLALYRAMIGFDADAEQTKAR